MKKEELDKSRFASNQNKPYKNENSDKYVMKRLQRELTHLKQEFDTQDAEQREEEQPKAQGITYERMVQIMQHMGFLPF